VRDVYALVDGGHLGFQDGSHRFQIVYTTIEFLYIDPVGIGISTDSISELYTEIFNKTDPQCAILKSKMAAIWGAISGGSWTKNLCIVLL